MVSKSLQRGLWGALLIGWLGLMLFSLPGSPTEAQTQSTPLPIRFPTVTGAVLPTVTPVTTRRQTVTAGVKVDNSTVNIRRAPRQDEENVIVTIGKGPFYPVLGRLENGEWVQIQYDPSIIGWVFGPLMEFRGDLAKDVPTIALSAITTVHPGTVAAVLTRTAIAGTLISTSGGFGSATSARSSATGVFLRTAGGSLEPTLGGIRPTFTYPPPFVEATLAPKTSVNTQSGIPPIVPIVALAVLGLCGLLVSSLRRL